MAHQLRPKGNRLDAGDLALTAGASSIELRADVRFVPRNARERRLVRAYENIERKTWRNPPETPPKRDGADENHGDREHDSPVTALSV